MLKMNFNLGKDYSSKNIVKRTSTDLVPNQNLQMLSIRILLFNQNTEFFIAPRFEINENHTILTHG